MRKNEKTQEILTWIAGIVISIATIYVLLISSFEIVAYADMNYYQDEYEKYGVAEDLNMEMEDIMYVTEEMMDFLRGDRDNLVIETTVGGEIREFFNETEISHMEDVQVLFISGLHGRLVCLMLAVGLYLILIFTKQNWQYVMPRAFQYTTIGVGIIAGILGGLFATDFYKYFEIFHQIFFEGDTWLFDPNTSLMINMLPEGLFYDMTLKVVLVFIGMMAILFIGACVSRKLNKLNKQCN